MCAGKESLGPNGDVRTRRQQTLAHRKEDLDPFGSEPSVQVGRVVVARSVSLEERIARLFDLLEVGHLVLDPGCHEKAAADEREDE